MNTFLPIFTFHALDDGAEPIAMTPQAFASGLRTLHAKGFRAIGLAQVAHCLAHRLPFPERSVVLTFDDGYASVYEQAFPILQAYKMSATVFIAASSNKFQSADTSFASMNGRTMLSWRQVRELHKYGIEIGAHTVTHPDLTRLAPAHARTEILRSQSILQEALGAPVVSFAYPFGRFDRNAYEIVKQHFACACTDRLELVTRHSNPHLLSRVDSYYFRNAAWFRLVPTDLLNWYVRARAVPRTLRRRVTSNQSSVISNQ